MAIDPATLKDLIVRGIPGATVVIDDVRGDGQHYAATVVSAQFAGKTRVEQHKMVFGALGAIVGNEVHALQLTTKSE
ncbi:MAG: BolA/IbaG family iron-sulfur metabolism protein [Micavibrio sp.]|nr:BolA/IbaG family iron-sulfur metabolism protein [Micavibrio sp.]